MSVSITFYDVTAAGSSNNLIANATPVGGNQGGPITSAVSSGSPLSWGNDQAQVWKAKVFLVGISGGTISACDFFLFDYVADVGGSPNAENFFDSNGNWGFKIRVSKTYISPSSFAQTDYVASPWVDLSHDPGSPFALDAAVTGLNPGNDGTTNLLVSSANYAGVEFLNAFVYVGLMPRANSLDGDHTNWYFKLDYVSP